MTDPRKQKFAPYIRRLADMIALKDWAIYVLDEPPEDTGANADVTIIGGRKLANIRLSEFFLDGTPESQRATLVHELVHCHLDTPAMLACDVMPKDAEAGFIRTFEIGVDGLTDGFAHLLPLPEPTVEPAKPRAARPKSRARGR